MTKIEKKPFKIIKTERLILKPHEVSFENAVMLYDIIKENGKFLTRFLPNLLKAKSAEDEYAFLTNCNENWKNMNSPAYGIWTKDGTFVGCCDFHNVEYENHSAEIGYWLDKKQTGKGYIAEAIKALEKDFFKRGFNRITLIMDTANKASEKVAIRGGYVKEGIMREWHYNPSFKSYRDMYLYAKIKSEWEKQR